MPISVSKFLEDIRAIFCGDIEDQKTSSIKLDMVFVSKTKDGLYNCIC